MSEDAGIVQGPTTDTDNGQVEPQEQKAPWADYLEPLPESVRPLVEPTFKKWDADVTQRFQQYSQTLEPYKAWDPVIQEFQDPQVAQQAAALMQAINDDPERVYRALAEQFGFDAGQGDEEADNGFDKPEDYVDPEFAQYRQMTENMAAIMLAQQEAERAAQEDAELDQYISGLKQKYGDFDDEYVLAHMHLGMDGEQAVAKFQSILQNRLAQVPTAPTILGSGGGLPSMAIDPGQLNSRDTKNLVAQMLAAQMKEE